MKKAILFLFNEVTRYLPVLVILLFAPCTVISQTVNYSIGTQNYNEVGVAVRPLDDGSSIIAGYIYDGSSVTDADMLLLKIKNGIITWMKRWGTANENDLIQDMIIAQNGDIIVVSTEGDPNSSNTIGCIYRFAPNGSLLYQDRSMHSNDDNGGTVYSSVCETSNGVVVAVGTRHVDPGFEQGVVVSYSSTLNYIFHDEMKLDHQIFKGVVPDVANPNAVIICGGYYSEGNPLKAALFNYTPPVSNAAGPGAYNWVTLFNITDDDNNHSMFNQIYYGYNSPVTQSFDRLLLSGIESIDMYGSSNSVQFSFVCNPYDRGDMKVVKFGNGNTYTNTSKIFPIGYNRIFDDFRVYINEHPSGTTINDPILAADAAIIKGVVTDITSLNMLSQNFCRSANVTVFGGVVQSLLDVRKVAPHHSLPTHVVGSTVGTNVGKDIYYSIFQPAYNKTTESGNCTHNNETVDLDYQIPYAEEPYIENGEVEADTLDNLSVENIDLHTRTLCGEEPPVPCGYVTLDYLEAITEDGDCEFIVTATTTPFTGYSITGYSWSSTLSPPFGSSNLVTTLTDSWAFTIPNGNFTYITVIVYLEDDEGNPCEVTETIYLYCDGDGEEIALSLKDPKKHKEVEIFPNPTKDKVNISSPETPIYRVSVFDLSGREVATFNFSNVSNATISLSNLANGTYLFKVNNNKASIINKID